MILRLVTLIRVSYVGMRGWLQSIILLSKRAIVPCFNGLVICALF